MIYVGDKCPNCKSQQTVAGFKGRIMVLNPEKSEIGKKLEITVEGEYAIKV